MYNDYRNEGLMLAPVGHFAQFLSLLNKSSEAEKIAIADRIEFANMTLPVPPVVFTNQLLN